MTELTTFLTDIPRWVTNLAFWVGLLALLICAWGVLRSFNGIRKEVDDALQELYDRLDELDAKHNTPTKPPSAPLTPLNNVRDIPTTRTAVARTDEAVEGLKATLGIPTDPDKLTAQPPAVTTELAMPYTDTTAADPTSPDGWAYVLAPDHKLEIVDGHTIPAFRDPADTPTAYQLAAPTQPDLQALPGHRLNGATRLVPAGGGRHRHPEDTE